MTPLMETLQFLRTDPRLTEWSKFRNERAIEFSSHTKGTVTVDAMVITWSKVRKVHFYSRWLARPLEERVCCLIHELHHIWQHETIGTASNEVAAYQAEREVAVVLECSAEYLGEIDERICYHSEREETT